MGGLLLVGLPYLAPCKAAIIGEGKRVGFCRHCWMCRSDLMGTPWHKGKAEVPRGMSTGTL